MLGLARRAVNEVRARLGLRTLVWAGLLATLAVALQFVPPADFTIVTLGSQPLALN